MKFEIYRSHTHAQRLGPVSPDKVFPKGDWRWRLRADNGQIVAGPEEGYKSAVTMTNTVRKYVIRADAEASQLWKEACWEAGLDETGRRIKMRV